jgi:hypothetical protein
MRRFIPLLVGALLLAMVMPGVVAAKKPTTSPVTVPIAGTVDAGGTVEITRFVSRDGQIVALGTFTGSVTDAAGAVTNGTQSLALPVAITGTCEILHLTLGPLDLNLLGLMVHLDQVVLNIDAQTGPGNLLGNLLCAIAGLLDPGPGPLAGIVALLNQILAILRGL